MKVRVATLNVWALPTPFAQQVEARMQAIGRQLLDLSADVVAFQEAWLPGARETLREAGRSAGLVHTWHRGSALGSSGLLVLSRLPIESVRFERFALRGHPERIEQGDYYGGKGFVSLRFRAEGTAFTLIDTHLHARYGSPHAYRSLRAGQIVQMAMAAREIAEPVVAAGDFNFSESQAGYTVLTGLTGLRDVAAELDRREATVFSANPYRNSNKRDRRKDYVFVRDGDGHAAVARSVRRVFDTQFEVEGRAAACSNHAGVLAEIEIVPRPSASRPRTDPRAVALAGQLLAEGRAASQQRQRDNRLGAGAGLAGAAIATVGSRRLTTRRRLMRSALQGAALLALTPGIGLSILSAVTDPDELEAFEELSLRLSGI